MTIYKLNHFTMTDAEPLAGKIADITEWGDDELETKITYPAAKVTGIIDRTGQYLNIETSGAVITDAGTGARLGTRAAEPDWNVGFALDLRSGQCPRSVRQPNLQHQARSRPPAAAEGPASPPAGQRPRRGSG